MSFWYVVNAFVDEIPDYLSRSITNPLSGHDPLSGTASPVAQPTAPQYSQINSNERRVVIKKGVEEVEKIELLDIYLNMQNRT